MQEVRAQVAENQKKNLQNFRRISPFSVSFFFSLSLLFDVWKENSFSVIHYLVEVCSCFPLSLQCERRCTHIDSRSHRTVASECNESFASTDRNRSQWFQESRRNEKY